MQKETKKLWKTVMKDLSPSTLKKVAKAFPELRKDESFQTLEEKALKSEDETLPPGVPRTSR